MPGSENSSGGNNKITGPEHVLEFDSGYNKRKIIRYSIIGGSVVILGVIIFIIFRITSQITIKNFVGTGISEANAWGITNKISIETEEEFSIEYDESIIISQDKEPESKIQKGTVLKFVVSKGPDPDEHIELPDFSTMTTSDIQQWKQQNKAVNVSVMQEFSDSVENNKYIRREYTDSSVTDESYLRSNSLIIYMSKGVETFEKNITVPDFAKKTKEEVAEWVKTNDINVTYTEAASETIATGGVISQDIPSGTKIAKKTSMTVVVSIGKTVTVPNFNTMTQSEAAEYTDMMVTIKTQYSSSAAYGRVISQSIAAGKQLTGEPAQITVIYSEGRPYIPNLAGKTEQDLQTFFHELNEKSANFSYKIFYVDSSNEKGTVTWATYQNEFAPLNGTIDIHISRGNLVPEKAIPVDDTE